MKKIKLSIIVFAVIALTAACFKVATTSEIPSIKFTSFEVFDTVNANTLNKHKAGRLKFRFEDGDGNFGVFDADRSDSTNLKLALYKKIDGEMRLITDDDPLLPGPDYTVPYLKTIGQSKVLRGEITVVILYLFYHPNNQGDIIKYEFFITDRAGNDSNIEETAEIIVSETGIYRKE